MRIREDIAIRIQVHSRNYKNHPFHSMMELTLQFAKHTIWVHLHHQDNDNKKPSIIHE